jgi:hypothetical protein
MSFVEVIRASCGGLAAREFSAFSIATRLSAWFVAIAAMLALVVGVGLYAALVTQLNRTSDEFLASDLEEMRATFRTAHLTEDNLSQKIDEEQEAHPPTRPRRCRSSCGTMLSPLRKQLRPTARCSRRGRRPAAGNFASLSRASAEP